MTLWTTREIERDRFRSADGRVDRSVPIVAGNPRRTVALTDSLDASPHSGPGRSLALPKGLRRPKRDQTVLAGRIAGIEFEKAVMELAQALSSADGPRVDVEEHRKLRDPLLKERSQVHQHERVPPSFGNHANPRHRLAHARRRDQHSDVMGPERAHGTWRNIRDDLKGVQLAQLIGSNGTLWQVTEPRPSASNRLKSLQISHPPPILKLA